jgi:hypothetical protein
MIPGTFPDPEAEFNIEKWSRDIAFYILLSTLGALPKRGGAY